MRGRDLDDEPWGLRLDLVKGGRAFVYEYGGALELRSRLPSDVKHEQRTHPNLRDARNKLLGAAIGLPIFIGIDVLLGEPEWFLTAFLATLVGVPLLVGLGVSAGREQRRRRRRP